MQSDHLKKDVRGGGTSSVGEASPLSGGTFAREVTEGSVNAASRGKDLRRGGPSDEQAERRGKEGNGTRKPLGN